MVRTTTYFVGSDIDLRDYAGGGPCGFFKEPLKCVLVIRFQVGIVRIDHLFHEQVHDRLVHQLHTLGFGGLYDRENLASSPAENSSRVQQDLWVMIS